MAEESYAVHRHNTGGSDTKAALSMEETMRVVKSVSVVVFLMFVFLLVPGRAAAQSATAGAIVGTITDPQQASVAGAKIQLHNIETNQDQEQTTSSSGQFSFPSVPPGTYKFTVTMQGFRTAVIENLKVDVAKSYTVDLKLELGELSQVVLVEATARVELQTTDATVGVVIPGAQMVRFPALTRQVNELLTLQPGATPTGEVTGARSDQSTFTIDGIDVTNNSVGGLGTFAFLPIDSIGEFKVGVANPNATFGRGAGGQVSLVNRSGTNQYHGAAYWYHQNDDLNANSWDNDRLGLKKPELKDNRFGGRVGGPLWFPWHKQTFFFVNYEGRRFPSAAPQSRIVPVADLKKGVLNFQDCASGQFDSKGNCTGSGNVIAYNLATSTACGPSGTGACDPRGLGLSPSILALWNLMPPGNDTSVAGSDGLNTTGFTTNVGTPLQNDFYDIKLDQNVTAKWHADVSYRYFRETQISALQLNIIGGKPSTVRSLPRRQNLLIAGLNGQITPRLSADFHFGWIRNRDATNPLRPNAVAALEAIAGTNTPAGFMPAGFIAMHIGAAGGTGINRLVDQPIDVNTQVARKQSNDNRNFQWNADFNWIRGVHTVQFGTHIRYLPTLHLRDDKVIGALGALVAQLDADIGQSVFIPAADRPRTCTLATPTNCIRTTDIQQWDRLYAGTLGLIDNISVLAVRDGSFNPLPFGNQLESDTKLWAPEFYVQDVWRMRPTFTVTLGVNYGWQTAPVERLGRQTIQIDAGTGQAITAKEFLEKRARAAASGVIFNPTFGFVPINSANRSVFDVDYGDVAPRIAFAWNPSRSEGLSGRLLGTGKTVLRGGFALVFDRLNTVQSVIIPALGVGFAQTLNLSPLCNATGAGGTGCNANSADPGLSVFRIGRDGTMPVPTFPVQGNPVVPFWGVAGGRLQLFPEIFSFQDDPSLKVGREYAFDLSIQRELPGNMLLEVAYAGRFGRSLPQSMSLGQSLINFKDPTSGQTFAQAFDAVATQLRAGTKPAAVTPQPWFQNLAPQGTVALATAQQGGFTNGNVSSIFLSIDQRRLLAGLPAFNNYLAQGIFFRSSTGKANYNAMLVTLNKRTSHGLAFTTNYTFSRSLDQIGAIQNAANLMPNSFSLNAEYGPSGFDFTHIFNTKWVYDLPFRSSNSFLKRAIEGWYISGIFTAISGQPLIVVQGTQVWGGTLALGFSTGAVPTVSPGSFGDGVHTGVTGSSNIGVNSNPVQPPGKPPGTGLNLFADPAAVFNSMRPVLLATDGRSGRSRPLRGLGHWNLDNSIGKRTAITERVYVNFAADFLNIFNHVIFADPGSLSRTSTQSFGVISNQFIPANRVNGSRWIQFSLRVEF